MKNKDRVILYIKFPNKKKKKTICPIIYFLFIFIKYQIYDI